MSIELSMHTHVTIGLVQHPTSVRIYTWLLKNNTPEPQHTSYIQLHSHILGLKPSIPLALTGMQGHIGHIIV